MILAVHELGHVAVLLAQPGVTVAAITAQADGYTVVPDIEPEGVAAVYCILAGVIAERIHAVGIEGARAMAERVPVEVFLGTPTGRFDAELVAPMMTTALLLQCFDRVAPVVATMLAGMDPDTLIKVEERLQGMLPGDRIMFRRNVQ